MQYQSSTSMIEIVWVNYSNRNLSAKEHTCLGNTWDSTFALKLLEPTVFWFNETDPCNNF